MQPNGNHLDFKNYSSLSSDYSSKNQEFSLPTHIPLPERQFTDLAPSARFARVASLQDTPNFSAGSLSPETPLNPPLAAIPHVASDPLICSPNHYWNYIEQHTSALPQDGVDGWVPSTPMTSPALTRDLLQFEKPAFSRMRSSHSNWIPQSGLNACGLTVPREFDGGFKGLNANAAEFMSTARFNHGPFNTVMPQKPLRPNDHAFSPPVAPVPRFGPEFDLPSPVGSQWMSCGPFPRPQIFDDHARQDSAPIPLRPRSNSRSNLRFSAPRIIDDEDQPLNFLQLLQPNSRPPYPLLVARIVKKADQQASIFIQQKLKNAPADERSRIVDAIVERGLEMMVSAEIATLGTGCSYVTNSKGGSATGVCSGAWNNPAQGRICSKWCIAWRASIDVSLLYQVLTPADRGHVVELATNVYSTHVVQKALDCDEDVRRLIVKELLADDIAKTLTSKHCSHVWAKVMEIADWTPPVPPIFAVSVILTVAIYHFLTLISISLASTIACAANGPLSPLMRQAPLLFKCVLCYLPK